MVTNNSAHMLTTANSKHGLGRLLACVTQIFLLLITILLIVNETGSGDWGTFIFWCRYGTAISAISILLYGAAIGSYVKPMMLVMLAFVSFQFGIPILYSFDSNFANWYVGELSGTYLVSGASFTVLCIQSFIIGASISNYRRKGSKRSKGNGYFVKQFINDNRSVTSIATAIFILTGIVVFVRAVLFLRVSLSVGIGGARAAYELGSFENIARGLFIPFGLLLIVYLPKGNKRSAVFIFLLLYSLLTAFSGDRTEGLTLLATLAFFVFGSNAEGTGSGVRVLGAITSFLVITWLLAFIAQLRVGNTGIIEGFTGSIVSALNEMGFNSLTVGFQMSLNEAPSNGFGYLTSLGTLIPNTFDILNAREAIDLYNPASHYYSTMRYQYGWATFGLGYSLIAEAYSNFGNYGWIAIGFLGAIIERLMDFGGDTKFERYLGLVFLWSFLTLPRRSTAWLVNSFEWNLLFVIIILWVWHQLRESRKYAGSSKVDATERGGASL